MHLKDLPLMFAAVANDKPFYSLPAGTWCRSECAQQTGLHTPLMLFEQSDSDDPEMTLGLY